MSKIEFLILGGGVSGLACQRALQKAGQKNTILEAGKNPGGLSRSEQVDRFTLDQAGHMLHLTRSSTPADIPFAGLNNADWERIRKKAFAWLGGRLVRAPVQYHLCDLGEPLAGECASSYLERPPEDNVNFKNYLVSGFGKKLSELFLIPQNEKNLAIQLDLLSVDSVKRFFPPPVERSILQGIKGGSAGAEEYNSIFWYPKKGGMGLLAEGLAGGCENVRAEHRVCAVDLERRVLKCANGTEWSWTHLISSLPLKEFCLLTKDEALRREACRLSQSSVLVFNIILNRPLEGPLSGVHWVYTPAKEIPFYRAGVYSNLSPSQNDPGAARLYVETGLPETNELSSSEEAALRDRVVDSLESLGWLRKKDILHLLPRLIPCAYVHYTPARRTAVPFITERLTRSGVSLIGRYGRWEYSSMEDSIYSGIETAQEFA